MGVFYIWRQRGEVWCVSSNSGIWKSSNVIPIVMCVVCECYKGGIVVIKVSQIWQFRLSCDSGDKITFIQGSRESPDCFLFLQLKIS